MSSTHTHTDTLVGIALAVYRPTPEYFEMQLASIIAQTHERWYCVLTLDSPLSEIRVHASLAPYLSDPRFIWHENTEPLGHKTNFQRAIELAAERGAAAIATCDQDDVWYECKLAVQLETLRTAGPGSLVHSDMHLLRGGVTDGPTHWEYAHRVIDNIGSWQLLVANKVTGCSMMFDAELARRFPRIPASFEYHDHWYALAASCVGRVVAVKEPLGAYRQHDANVIGAETFDWSVNFKAIAKPSVELRASRDRWLRLVDRFNDAVAEGLAMPRSLRRLLFGRDLGLRLALYGLRYFFTDPRLARLCLRIALGKLASHFRTSRQPQ